MAKFMASVIPEGAGVYRITSTASGMKYYGSALNMKTRFYAHNGELGRNNHPNQMLQSEYNSLYPSEYFEFSVLVICKIEYAREIESKLILADRKKCFNVVVPRKFECDESHASLQMKSALAILNRIAEEEFDGVHGSKVAAFKLVAKEAAERRGW